MSTPFELFATAGTRTQEATTAAMRGWSDGMRALSDAQSALADAPDLYARYVGGLRTVLAGQRQLMDAMVDAAQVAQSFTHQATTATEGILESLQAAAAGTAQFAQVAGAQTAALARAAR